MRTRNLQQVNDKLKKQSQILTETLQGMVDGGAPINVLEIGFGEGRALLELASLFQMANVRFFGVDKNPTPLSEEHALEGLRDTVRRFDIVEEGDLEAFRLPDVSFYDAHKLQFEDESLDLIYSSSALCLFERKAEFLGEVSRVMRPGGVALLHLAGAHWNYPYGRRLDNALVTPYRSAFVLLHGDDLIPLPIYLKLFERDNFRFEFMTTGGCVLKITKLCGGVLDLQLQQDDRLSGRVREKFMPGGQTMGHIRGFRSIYHVKDENYAALLARDLIDQHVAGPESFR